MDRSLPEPRRTGRFRLVATLSLVGALVSGCGGAADGIASLVGTPPGGEAAPPASAAGTGGSGGDTGAPATVAAPTAPTLTATGTSGALRLAWTAGAGASSYVVQKRLGAEGDWTDDGAALDETVREAERRVRVADWSGARYRVRACNAGGCTASGEVQALQAMPGTARYLKASNTGAGDAFSGPRSVALSADGTTLAVGAWGEDSAATGVDGDQASEAAMNSGAVYVFVRSAGAWSQQAYLKATHNEAGDLFGTSVALSADGHTLAIGAPGESSAGLAVDSNAGGNSSGVDTGAAYVFRRTGTSWAQQAYLKAPNARAGDAFGERIALSADGATLAVGAPGEDSSATGVDGNELDSGAPDSGAVHVFARSGANWIRQAYLKPSNTDGNDEFGREVAISADGGTLAVGAPGEDSAATGANGDASDNTAADSGAVYVFGRDGSGWTQRAYLKASNTGAGDRFGESLAVSADGGTLAIGARFEAGGQAGPGATGADDSVAGAGAVYVFGRVASGWAQQAYLKSTAPAADDRFGSSVALTADGTMLAVAVPREDTGGAGFGGAGATGPIANSGGVQVFARDGSTWTPRATLKATNPGVADRFGTGVSMSADGSTIAVGAASESSAETGVSATGTDDSAPSAGAVYTF